MNELNELAKALSAAQGSFTNPAKDRENPYFKSRYATLDALQNATRKPLSENGLSISQGGQMLPDGAWVLRTTLLHQSGQSITSEFPLLAFSKGAQAAGSEITYMRRYAYAAMLSIAADEDDDANAAQPKQDLAAMNSIQQGSAWDAIKERPIPASSQAFLDEPSPQPKVTGELNSVEASKDGECLFAKIGKISVWTREKDLMVSMAKHQGQTITAHVRGGKKPGVFQLNSFVPA